MATQCEALVQYAVPYFNGYSTPPVLWPLPILTVGTYLEGEFRFLTPLEFRVVRFLLHWIAEFTGLPTQTPTLQTQQKKTWWHCHGVSVAVLGILLGPDFGCSCEHHAICGLNVSLDMAVVHFRSVIEGGKCLYCWWCALLFVILFLIIISCLNRGPFLQVLSPCHVDWLTWQWQHGDDSGFSRLGGGV